MVAFLGWVRLRSYLCISLSPLTRSDARQVTILHWGPNKLIYPFFSFADPSDPYTYRLTISASLVIWLAELFSSFLARLVCWLAYGIDVTNVSPPFQFALDSALMMVLRMIGWTRSIPRACKSPVSVCSGEITELTLSLEDSRSSS